MKLLQHFTFKLSLIAVLSTFASSTYAGTPVITYGPGATGVPTLSGVMLVVLSLLLFVIAIRITKQKGKQGSKLFVTLLGATTLISGISGVNMISDADAIASGSISLSDGTSGTHTQPFDYNVINTITNNATPAIPISIFAIDYAGCPNNPITNRCSVGTTLSVGANCLIDCEQVETTGCFSDVDCPEGQSCVSSPGSDLGGVCKLNIPL